MREIIENSFILDILLGNLVALQTNIFLIKKCGSNSISINLAEFLSNLLSNLVKNKWAPFTLFQMLHLSI